MLPYLKATFAYCLYHFNTFKCSFVFCVRVPANVDIHIGHVCIRIPMRCVTAYEKAVSLQTK